MLNRLSGLPLPLQVVCLGGGGAAAVLLAAAWAQGLAGPAWGWALGAAAAGVAGACWPAQRAARSARDLAAAARALCLAEVEPATAPAPAAADPAGAAAGTTALAPVGAPAPSPPQPPPQSSPQSSPQWHPHLPTPAPASSPACAPLSATPATASPELDEAAQQLRRLVSQVLQQREQLDLRVASLGQQLDSHAQALSTLAALSIGLARPGNLGELVAEALRLLDKTMAFTSASVWGHAQLDPAQPVVLLGYRSQADALAGPPATGLVGQALPRTHLQQYEQIERSGTAIVDNRARPGLLSGLRTLVGEEAGNAALHRSTRAWIALPLKVNDRVLGVLRVDHGEADFFDAERIRLLDAVASQTALALSHAQALARERAHAVAAERTRIAQDLHDAVSQTLFASSLLAGTLARSDTLDAALRQQAQTLESLNRSALAEMRMMLFELRPDALEGVRLADLLQQATQALSGRGGVQVQTDLAPDPNLPSPLRIEVYRIAQEALSNIGRHSGARHAQISWRLRGPAQGVLRIADDGCGFDPGAPYPGHFGLENMRRRAQKLGAALQIRSAPGQGCELVLDLHWNS